MFEWNDILILGDSFVGHRDLETDWPQLLTCKLTGLPFDEKRIPRGHGFNGSSWWSVRNRLHEELKIKKPKVLILTHTEPQRIPSDDNYNLNPGSVENPDWHKQLNSNEQNEVDANAGLAPREVLLAGQQYYKYLISIDYHLWTQEKWYEELDNLISTSDIEYVIHMHCFDPWKNKKLHEFKNSITFNKPIWQVSDDSKKWSIHNRNHFTLNNNKKMMEVMYTCIENYNHGFRDLKL